MHAARLLSRPALPAQLRPSPCRASKPLVARRQAVRVAAAAGSAGEDPYQVLGLLRSADSAALQRAYRLKLSQATSEEEKARIEAAHTSIMMSALTSRLQGKAAVNKDVRYADRAQYFPWRPRLCVGSRTLVLYPGVLQAACLAWALLMPQTANLQPVVSSAMVGFVANMLKQNQLFPVPPRGEGSEETKKQGGKNIIRAAFLAFLATFAGCYLFYTLPDLVASLAGKVLPPVFYESQHQLLAVGTCLFNWVITAFYR